MSSPLLLRSAIQKFAVTARYSRHSSFRKSSSLPPLSFHPSLFNDARCDCATDVVSTSAPPLAHVLTTYNNIASNLSNMIVTAISGNSALATSFQSVKQLEEERDWEDIVPKLVMESSSVEESQWEELSIWKISTLKRRKKMMNKHKLRKRKKKMRLKTRRQ